MEISFRREYLNKEKKTRGAFACIGHEKEILECHRDRLRPVRMLRREHPRTPSVARLTVRLRPDIQR